MTDDKEKFDLTLKSQGELIGSLAHDLKGLLNGIDGGVYLVDSGLKKDKKERIDQGFEMMKRNLVRIRRTVSNVMYYVKDREIDWEPVSIEGLFAAVKKDLGDYASHLEVSLDIDEGASGTFESGAHPVQATLVNLLEFCLHTCAINEDKASNSISLTGTVDDAALFTVQVKGFALEPDTCNRVFDDHYAPKGADRSHLSLFITNRVVKRQGGTFAIASSLESNTTTFEIRLPKAK